MKIKIDDNGMSVSRGGKSKYEDYDVVKQQLEQLEALSAAKALGITEITIREGQATVVMPKALLDRILAELNPKT